MKSRLYALSWVLGGGLGVLLVPLRGPLAFSTNSQIVQDLEGLDASQSLLSASSLRGSYVVKRYVSGPYKGGRAVIEVAQDLAYAEIRIFDKDGQLQRIYSIQPASEKQPSSGLKAKPAAPVSDAKPAPAVPPREAPKVPMAKVVPAPPPVTVEAKPAVPARSEAPAKANPRPRPKPDTLDIPLSGVSQVDEEQETPQPASVARKTLKPSSETSQDHGTAERVRPVSANEQPSAPTQQMAVLNMSSPPLSAAVSAPKPLGVAPSISESVAPPEVREAQSAQEHASDSSKTGAAGSPLESDRWTPPRTVQSVPPSDHVLKDLEMESQAVKPAKPPLPSPNPADDLAQLVQNAKAWKPESDQWAPSKERPRLGAGEERIQSLLNDLKPVTAPVAPPKSVKPHVEEGVGPFSYLEKFSGPQYGRHREFERRVITGHNKRSSVQGYDFYVDEVDRKQEKHYLYFYRVNPKSQEPKLIAMEKHDHVTFLSDYDIDSDGQGKITTY